MNSGNDPKNKKYLEWLHRKLKEGLDRSKHFMNSFEDNKQNLLKSRNKWKCKHNNS